MTVAEVAALRFGMLEIPDGGPGHHHRPVTSPNYVLHATVEEIDVALTLCGKRIGRWWARGNVLTKSECATCAAMQETRYS